MSRPTTFAACCDIDHLHDHLIMDDRIHFCAFVIEDQTAQPPEGAPIPPPLPTGGC